MPRHELPAQAPIYGYRKDGRPIRAVMGGDDTVLPAADATPPDPGRAGGDAALRADLARERDRRQAVERERDQLRQSQTAAQQANEAAETARVRQQLESERDTARTQAATAIARSVRTEANRLAHAEGVRSERIETFLRLVDLTGVQVADDGTIDETGIKVLVVKALDDAPEFRTRTGPGERRAEPGAGHGAGSTPPADLQAQVSAALAAMQQSVGIAQTA